MTLNKVTKLNRNLRAFVNDLSVVIHLNLSIADQLIFQQFDCKRRDLQIESVINLPFSLEQISD